MKKKNKNILGVTLVEILITIVITSIMMGGMYATYSAVNKTYGQVIDKATCSRTSREVIEMISKDIRLAGFKYYGDGIIVDDTHLPISITRNVGCCDSISIIYGNKRVDENQNPPLITYQKYRITYTTVPSNIIDRGTGNAINSNRITKRKEVWNTGAQDFEVSMNDNETYPASTVADYVDMFEIIPMTSTGTVITPAPTTLIEMNNIKSVELLVALRSGKPVFVNDREQTVISLHEDNNRIFTDRFLRNSATATVSLRNLAIAR